MGDNTSSYPEDDHNEDKPNEKTSTSIPNDGGGNAHQGEVVPVVEASVTQSRPHGEWDDGEKGALLEQQAAATTDQAQQEQQIEESGIQQAELQSRPSTEDIGHADPEPQGEEQEQPPPPPPSSQHQHQQTPPPSLKILGEEDGQAVYDEANELALIREFGSHPLMQRVQDALLGQLQQTYDRLKGQIRIKEEDLKRTKDKRETIGVELYGQQQQLARLQSTLEKFQNSFGACTQERTVIEADIAKIKRTLNNRREEVLEKERQLARNHQELEALNDTLRQVAQYNEETKSEISVTRRATYKVEEALQQLEKQKKGQDLYINSLTRQLKNQRDQLSLFDAQLEAQRKETTEADAVLRDTAKEMETLRFEKKQLMLQWRSSLIGLTRRDEALAAALEVLREAQVSAKDYDTEIEGIKRDNIKAQAKNETLVSVHDRLESETKYVEEQLNKTTTEQAALVERYGMLERSKTETEQEEANLDQSAVTLRQQIEGIAHNIQVVTRERQKVEDEIERHKNEQTTTSKAVRNLNKSAAQVVKQMHDKEIEIAGVKNELARFQVDELNTKAQVSQLKSTLEKLDQDLKTKDKVMEKYELEIRQRNDDIEKKMYRVDRLNKKYQQMMDSVEDPECMGPLESTIKSLKKDIEKTEGECLDLQKSWLNDQTRLVHSLSRSETQTEKNADLKAKAGILHQQQVRLLQDVKTNKDKFKGIDSVLGAMHKDISRINDLIDRTTKFCSELQNTNYISEKEFVEELKRLEGESVEAEAKLREVHGQKAKIMDQILETERQAMLWEKKIELEKETQAALDPEAGMSECRAMEKEIHRMRLRLDTLKREQERLIVEMERAVYKHETIALRNKGGLVGGAAAPRAAAARSQMTNVALRKRLRGLKNGLKMAQMEAEDYDHNIDNRRTKLKNMTQELENATTKYDELEKESQDLQHDINGLLFKKQRQADALGRKQLMANKLSEVLSLKQGPIIAESNEERKKAEMEYEAAVLGLKQVQRILGDVKEKYPQLTEIVSRVVELGLDVEKE